MPPYIEIDAHHDEWPEERQPTSLLGYDEHHPSPLFLDYRELPSKVPPESRLDLRQSDPDLSAVPPREEEVVERREVVATAVPVSRITAIIGPESRYVRTKEENVGTGASTGTGAGSRVGDRPPQPSAPEVGRPPGRAPDARRMFQVDQPQRPPSNANANPFARASARASKKGWKVVKSLPNKLVSTVGNVKVSNVKIPHYRNAV